MRRRRPYGTACFHQTPPRRRPPQKPCRSIAHLRDAQSELDLVESLLNDFPDPLPVDPDWVLPNGSGNPAVATGPYLRGVRQFFVEVDRFRRFGDLEPALADSGQYRWLCPLSTVIEKSMCTAGCCLAGGHQFSWLVAICSPGLWLGQGDHSFAGEGLGEAVGFAVGHPPVCRE
jgi:hypothetical protein